LPSLKNNPKMENPNKKIKTLADDMTDVIKENKDGVIKKIIHQEEAKDKARELRSPETPRNKRFLFFGTLFLFLALGAFAFGILSKDSFIIQVAPRFRPIIFNEEHLFFDVADLKTEEIATQLDQILAETEVPKGGILGTYPTHGKKVLKLNNFMEVLGSEFRATRDNFIKDN